MEPLKRTTTGSVALLVLAILQFAAGLTAVLLVDGNFDRLAGPPRVVTNLNDSWLIMMKDSVDALHGGGSHASFLTSRINSMEGVALETAEGLPDYLVVRHSGLDSNLVWVIAATSRFWDSNYHVLHTSKLPDFLQEERKRIAKR